jgi:hypothetical protein
MTVPTASVAVAVPVRIVNVTSRSRTLLNITVTIMSHTFLPNQRHGIPHLRVSTKVGLAFRNSQSSAAAMLRSATASVTSQILINRREMNARTAGLHGHEGRTLPGS